jgi:Zn-dependent peptidase ImmA (M78 family)
MSTTYIRNIAKLTRMLLDSPNDKFLDVAKALDVLTDKLAKHNFNYMILPDNDPLFERKEEAKTDVLVGTIYIKESVFNEAAHKRYCRAHYTIAHEIGHFILHRALNTLNFARTSEAGSYKVYENPEWQADTFASELLMPYEQCLELSPQEIRRKYHVSKAAANTRYRKIHK